jgi:hypothetical protein
MWNVFDYPRQKIILLLPMKKKRGRKRCQRDWSLERQEKFWEKSQSFFPRDLLLKVDLNRSITSLSLSPSGEWNYPKRKITSGDRPLQFNVPSVRFTHLLCTIFDEYKFGFPFGNLRIVV